MQEVSGCEHLRERAVQGEGIDVFLLHRQSEGEGEIWVKIKSKDLLRHSL